MSEEQEKKGEKKEEEKEEEVEKEEKKEVNSNMQTGPATNQLFFGRNIFKEKIIKEEESQSLSANNDYE